jgi:hypothetical protein
MLSRIIASNNVRRHRLISSSYICLLPLSRHGQMGREREGVGGKRKKSDDAGAWFSWLEPLPITQEAAGSSPVAPAIPDRQAPLNTTSSGASFGPSD